MIGLAYLGPMAAAGLAGTSTPGAVAAIAGGGAIGVGGTTTAAAGSLSVEEILGGLAIAWSIIYNQINNSAKNKISQSRGSSGALKVKSVEDILEGAEEATNGAGVARNYEKAGGFEKTLEDFELLNPSNVKDIQT